MNELQPITQETNIAPISDVMDFSVFDTGQPVDGNENVRADDLQTMYIRIIEGMSDYVKRQSGNYIAGAEIGMLVNNVTKELFAPNTGIIGIPVYYEKLAVEWTQESKSRRVASHPIDSPIFLEAQRLNQKSRRKKLLTPNKENEIVETAYHFFLQVYPNGQTKQVVLAMTGTRLKKSNHLNTLILEGSVTLPNGKVVIIPRYTQMYHLTTGPEKGGENGDDYNNWNVAYVGPVTDRKLCEKAMKYRDMCLDTREREKALAAEGDEKPVKADAGASQPVGGRPPAAADDNVPF
jgi:hypothetical protein